MPIRPNFTDAILDGGLLRVHGQSDDDDFTDIANIQVTISQRDKVASGPVDTVVPDWVAELEVGEGTFREGDALAVGVEVRFKNMTTITWTQPVKIRERPHAPT